MAKLASTCDNEYMTTADRTRAFTAAEAVDIADAAVATAGGHVPAWARTISKQVAAGALTGDAAVDAIRERLARETPAR